MVFWVYLINSSNSKKQFMLFFYSTEADFWKIMYSEFTTFLINQDTLLRRYLFYRYNLISLWNFRTYIGLKFKPILQYDRN